MSHSRNVITIIAFYFICVNLLGLVSFFIDKQKAKRQSWRTPEATLITIALFGGSIGCLLGMYLFRHKTQKPKFFVGIPVILFLQILVIVIVKFCLPIDFMIL